MDVNKPHAVCIPYPIQSHVKGSMKVAKLLNTRGFYITFVNTEYNQNRLIKANGSEKFESLENIKFETIPDGLPPSNPEAAQDPALLCGSIRRNFLKPFCDLITKINDRSCNSSSPPVTCIVADVIMPFAVTVGKELGIPVALFCTFAACAFTDMYQNRAILEKGENYLTNDCLEEKNREVFNLLAESTEMAVEATCLGIHTFDALEYDVLQALSSIFPRVYAIGPLQLLLDQASENGKLDALSSYNLWREEPECLKWLESKEPGSVLYVNFGSITVMSLERLVEFAWGLANSNKHFLWIIRPDLVIGDSAILPNEFSKQAKEKGFIASWCPQEDVLNHRSIGGFLTHCGWNSTIESLSAGVPMICWPYNGDQTTNCRYICKEWEVGMEIDSDVKRENVEKLIRELMDGEKGKRMKDKAIGWKKFAAKAASPNGSSSLNLDKMVNLLISKE